MPTTRISKSFLRSPAALKLLLGILVLALLFLIASRNSWWNPEQASSTGTRENSHFPAEASAVRDMDDPAGFKKGQRKPAEPAPVERRDAKILKKEIEQKVRDLEKFRCRTLANFSNEINDYVLVAVDPPTDEEKKEVQHLMGSLLKECQDSQREDFDRYLTELDKNYDPLGKLGKRAFFIIISQGSEAAHCSAYSFSVTDFETLPAMLDPKGGNRYKMKNVRWYQNPKGGVLQRLSHIMQ